jgi:superoxide dismutase, Cu-Zn family
MNNYFNTILKNGLVCVLKCSKGSNHVIVKMFAKDTPDKLGVLFYIKGVNIKNGLHGFHVHNGGDLSDGCISLGPHYNPTNKNHGDLNDPNAHKGDLGNIYFNEDNICEMSILSNQLCLYELLGRSLVIHTNVDDLGLGGNAESLKTGNSGARICCGVIGLI